MSTEIQLWTPSTALSLEQKVAKSREIVRYATSPREAFEAGRTLIGQWPSAKAPNPDAYAAAIGAALSGYPLGVMRECIDPRTGLAREREYPPTVAAVVEWCDKRLSFHQALASYQGRARQQGYVEGDYSSEHRANMLQRLSKMMHETFGVKQIEPADEPVGSP